MSIQEIPELLDLFNQKVSAIKEKLTDLLVMVSDGRVPSQDIMSVFDQDIQGLQEDYARIYETARTAIPEEELPEPGSSVAKIAEAVRNSKSRIIKKQLAEARTILEKFTRVKSLLAEYAQALKPYQETALSLLRQLNEETVGDILPQTEAPHAFLSAMETENISCNPAGIQALEDVSRFYPKEIQWGLVGRQYFAGDAPIEADTTEELPTSDKVTEETPEVAPAEPVEAAVEASEEAPVKPAEVPAVAPEEAPAEPVEAAAETSEDAPTEPVEAAGEAPEEAPAEPAEVTAETPAAPAPAAEEADPAVQTPVNKPKASTPSATAFRKEMLRIGDLQPGVTVILPMLLNQGLLTKKQMHRFGVCMDIFYDSKVGTDCVDEAVECMTSKGFLTCFEYEEAGVTEQAYCLSGYCSSCMKKESVINNLRGFWELSYGSRSFCYDHGIKASLLHQTLKSNALLLQFFQNIGAKVGAEACKSLYCSIRWKNGFYQIPVTDKKTLYFCSLVPSLSAAITLPKHTNPLFLSTSSDLALLKPGVFDHVFVEKDGIVQELFTEKPVPPTDPPVKTPAAEKAAPAAKAPTKKPASAPKAPEKPAPEKAPAEKAEQPEKEAAPEEPAAAEQPVSADVPAEENDSPSDVPFVETNSPIEKLPAEEEISNQSAASPKNQNPAKSSAHTDKAAPEEEPPVPDTENSVVITPEKLVDCRTTPTDSDFRAVIHNKLTEAVKTLEELKAVISQSVLLAYCAGLEEDRPESAALSQELCLATGLLFGDVSYDSDYLASVYPDCSSANSALMLASYLLAMLHPATPYDYGLKDQTQTLFKNYDEYFGDYSAFKPLFSKLLDVRESSINGFTPAVIAQLGDEAEGKQYLSNLQNEAKQYLSNYSPNSPLPGLAIMFNNCFGPSSDFAVCLSIICSNKTDPESLEKIRMVLQEYCDERKGTFAINQGKIEDRIDLEWSRVTAKKEKFQLKYQSRNVSLRQIRVRLDLMISWLTFVENQNGQKIEVSRLRGFRGAIQKLIPEISRDPSWKKLEHANVLSWLLYAIKTYLSGRQSSLHAFSDLLFTGIISVNEHGEPIIDPALAGMKFYEPWRNVLRHILAPKRSIEEIKTDILGSNMKEDEKQDTLKDNLHQLEMLGKFLGSTDEDYTVTQAQVDAATASADVSATEFHETLEIAYTYNRINELEKETLSDIMDQFKSAFYEVRDFACWKRFLKALQDQIHEFAMGRKRSLRAKLDVRLQKNSGSKLLQAADRLLEEDENFAVAEEYITRFDNGEVNQDGETEAILDDKDYFRDFLSPEQYDPLLNHCIHRRGNALKNFGTRYVERNHPQDWTQRLVDDSRDMTSNWPSNRDVATPQQMVRLFRHLGFDAYKAEKVRSCREELFQLFIHPTRKGMADYRHPIAAFGTQARSVVNVIILTGSFTPRQLVDTVASLNLGPLSVVLMINQYFDRANRRYVGELFHKRTTGENSFLLVDQVLFLYLALLQETERLPALLQCTLPYTTYQPFVCDGGSTSDEMFYGRTTELATIIDPGGACVVYGGRQLGKTALLERAESRVTKPDAKEFGVYVSIVHMNSEEAVTHALINAINAKTDSQVKLTPCKTLEEMCSQLQQLYRQKRFNRLLLLVDEVDAFLGSIAEDKYIQLQPLVDLRRWTGNDFKFVLTGLHNVCRAKNAIRDNGIFGQVGTPLCIKPLSPLDALKLISRPLSYLGFQIERYPHLETILTNTNYYPGILQFFGYILVQTLNKHYAKYYHANTNNPPFTLHDKQLGAVMDSSDLNKSIKDKFRCSLELDPRYFMIARCIAVLYHCYEEDRQAGSWLGFEVNEIRDIAEFYEIHCLEHETYDSFVALLDEMVEMGILSQPKSRYYRLRRSSFIDIIGETIEDVEKEIKNGNTEEEYAHV